MAFPTLTTADWALVVSTFALLVSMMSLAWNVYRELGLRARLNISIKLVALGVGADGEIERRVLVHVVSRGPGSCHITNIAYKRTVWQRFARKRKYGSVVPPVGDVGDKLPAKLETGDAVHLFLPYEEGIFLKTRRASVGVKDSLGRYHWAPRNELRTIEKRYRQTFILRKNGSRENGGEVKETGAPSP